MTYLSVDSVAMTVHSAEFHWLSVASLGFCLRMGTAVYNLKLYACQKLT